MPSGCDIEILRYCAHECVCAVTMIHQFVGPHKYVRTHTHPARVRVFEVSISCNTCVTLITVVFRVVRPALISANVLVNFKKYGTAFALFLWFRTLLTYLSTVDATPQLPVVHGGGIMS